MVARLGEMCDFRNDLDEPMSVPSSVYSSSFSKDMGDRHYTRRSAHEDSKLRRQAPKARKDVHRGALSASFLTTFTLAMFANSSNFRVGDVSQINTESFSNYGTTSSRVTVNDGGHYSPKIEINAGVYNQHEGSAADPLKDLYAHVAVGAMHNSAERYDAPKCHPETRKAVQGNIFSWIDEGEPGQLLWLTGPAGVGKTAIMGTVCDTLKETGRLAATFYFSSFSGSPERKSKRYFVTTLAYQLQGHPKLKHRLSAEMLSTIRSDPAILRMELKEQMEALVLIHLHNSRNLQSESSRLPLVVAVDGIDECGEDAYDGPNRSREQDQLEILSVLIQVVRDLDFPCRLIAASRPERWIRRFFENTGYFTEIFLDDKYDPDKDIEIFLTSKFGELSRRYGFPPSTWPRKKDIKTLVQNASGQFIYASTVIRFIDGHGQPPKQQLDVVLSIGSIEAGSNPFGPLDALYITILNSSPSPSETVLWLKAERHLNIKVRSVSITDYYPSAWTIDRIFESSEGQAQLLFGLPSLVTLQERPSRDSYEHGRDCRVPESSIPNSSWTSSYSYYHKSFLDFLNTPRRSEAAFPEVDVEKVVQWLWGRLHRVWQCGGPEVPIDDALMPTFQACITYIMYDLVGLTGYPQELQQDVLSQCDPSLWFRRIYPVSRPSEEDTTRMNFLDLMFKLVHSQCRFYRPCKAGCRRWRKAISELPDDMWALRSVFGPRAMFLDRHESYSGGVRNRAKDDLDSVVYEIWTRIGGRYSGIGRQGYLCSQDE
ncbi:hypothetical protein NMY22_g15658 [Coprinellus aureogranulatus]|nr:hypothetical protein NMY22_g15658 [Coprinellus aureogranulatus]